jgi:hypothetical protein
MVSDATTYTVWRAPVGSGSYQPIGSVSGTTFTNNESFPGSRYRYVITAINSKGQSAPSIPIIATVPCGGLSAPTEFSADMTTNVIKLKWNSATGASGYILNRATNSGGPYSSLADLDTTNYTDSSAVPRTVYFYVVSATNSCGTIEDSEEISAPLSFLSPIRKGSSLTIRGWGGKPSKAFVLLSTTNLMLPLSKWERLSTNMFGPGGFFAVTNSIDALDPTEFFNIEVAQP